ncbi:MAG: hypothetical protein CSA50_02450 [Gammaproteobacteria bacterium]|nr:MAG: hypothetical protein CSA50_02450 [Gammaproteobacteria bacterium]
MSEYNSDNGSLECCPCIKLLQEFDNKEEAKIFAITLLNKGIAVHLSGAYSSNHRIVAGTVKVGVWVAINEQLEDALHLVKNPDHEVVYGA